MAVVRSDERVEYRGTVSVDEVEAAAPSLEALGPAGKRAVEVLRDLAGAVDGLRKSIGELNSVHAHLVTTSDNGTLATAFVLTSGSHSRLDPPEHVLARPLNEFGLSVRLQNIFEAEGINTVRQLLLRSEHQLLAVRNFGEPILKEVREKILQPLGVTLASRGLSQYGS